MKKYLPYYRPRLIALAFGQAKKQEIIMQEIERTDSKYRCLIKKNEKIVGIQMFGTSKELNQLKNKLES